MFRNLRSEAFHFIFTKYNYYAYLVCRLSCGVSVMEESGGGCEEEEVRVGESGSVSQPLRDLVQCVWAVPVSTLHCPRSSLELAQIMRKTVANAVRTIQQVI